MYNYLLAAVILTD